MNSTTNWIRVGAENFIDNSHSSSLEVSDAPNEVNFAIVSIVIAVLILLHSFQIHRMKFNTIRLLTDVCALGNILGSIALLICKFDLAYLM